MTSNSARFGGPSEEVSTDTGGEATEEDRHRLAEPGDALHGPQDGEGVPRLLQPTQETRAAPRPKDLQGISTPETTYIKCTRNVQEITTEFPIAPESGDHVPKDDRDTGTHQPFPDRRALRHGASAPTHQRARLQDRHALLPAV